MDANFYWKGIEEDNHINLEYHDGEPSTIIWYSYKAYTLEQIIDILELELQLRINITPTDFEIHNQPLFESSNIKFQFWEDSIERLDGDNLATTAAKLLIKLKQDKII